jgi:phospholipid/cholesterol/gamma-HCH transport system substrate-binding protein
MKFTKEIKIALVAILAIVVLFFGLQFLKGLTIFSNDDSYYVTFNDVSGLSPSSPIYANGYKVGVVKDIIYDYSPEGKIVAVMGLDKNMRLPQGSHAEIASDLLGNIKVNLVLGDDPLHMLAAGDTISGGAELGMMSKLGSMMPAVEAILPKLDSIMSSLNTLLANPAIAQSLHNVQNITANLTTTTAEANRLMAQLNNQVPGMMSKANGVLDNTSALTEGLNQKLAEVDVATTMAKIDQTLANVNAITEQMNSREGSLGLLMSDPALYNNLNATMRDADSLLLNLRAHPKRYVHFSIFGKKDK